VRNVGSGKILAMHPFSLVLPYPVMPGRYKNTPLRVRLCKDGKRSHGLFVHRLVAEAFLGPAPPGMPDVRHKDGDWANNAATNLEWRTSIRDVRQRMRDDAVIDRRLVRDMMALRQSSFKKSPAGGGGPPPARLSLPSALIFS